MTHEKVVIETADGRCPAHVYHPGGGGPWPGVVVYLDGMGMRPAMQEIAERLAGGGYYVLLPDIFYRVGTWRGDPATLFTDPASRADFTSRVAPAVSAPNVMRDTEIFLDFLDRQGAVRSGPVGVTGYCLGGRLAVIAAGTFGERIAAAGSYHPSNLATDAADSPHLLAPRMRARVYVGRAKEDRGFDDAQLERLERALTDARVPHTIETYDARHGWVPSDTPVHDPAEAERHWRTLFDLLGGALGAGRA